MADQRARAAALLRELSHGAEFIRGRLAAAGFDGIGHDEIIAIAAAGGGKGRTAVADLAQKLPMPAEVIEEVMRGLAAHGYMNPGPGPDQPGGPATGLTEQGLTAFALIVRAAKSKRWADFDFRPGDIVITTSAKSGTTWTQMICALLIFQTTDLPAPLPQLSPWLDQSGTTRDQVYPQLAAQRHRRFIKTHLGLDEMLLDPRADFIAVARHPLDAALSYYHHLRNAGRRPLPATPREALLSFIDTQTETDPTALAINDMMHQLSQAWARREDPNVVLVHYDDLCADLPGQMRRLARHLRINVPEATWPSLEKAASFEQMRARAGQLQPLDSLPDPQAFFRSGSSGLARELLTNAELSRYHQRAARLAPPELLAWLHR